MSAWAVWSVHCTNDENRSPNCWHYVEGFETKGEAQRAAKRLGWSVRKDGNTCPECLPPAAPKDADLAGGEKP